MLPPLMPACLAAASVGGGWMHADLLCRGHVGGGVPSASHLLSEGDGGVVEEVARLCVGYVAADLEALVREAAMQVGRQAAWGMGGSVFRSKLARR